MNRHSDIELILNDTEIMDSINKNGYYMSNENSFPINYDYKHLSNKPNILNEKKLEYVMFTPKSYFIGDFNLFLGLPTPSEVKNVVYEFDSYTTLNPLDVSTKSTALLLAYYTGIINDFIGEDVTLTHIGDLPSQNYDFFIITNNNRQKISLRNYSPIIDGVFESENKVVLVYSELYKSEDVSLKELFIPYLHFSSNTTKEVIVVYMTFSNDLFKLTQINFNDSDIMNEAYIIKTEAYKISNDNIVFNDILNLFNTIKIISEKEVPFPQANDFEKIIDLIHILSKSKLNIEEIASNYRFVERQSNYYTDACIYLNLVQTDIIKRKKVFYLTEKAKDIVSSKIKSKYLKLASSILEHEVFYKTLKHYIEFNEIPSTKEIVEIMKTSKIYNVQSESTFFRRASTVQSWIKWIINLPKIYY